MTNSSFILVLATVMVLSSSCSDPTPASDFHHLPEHTVANREEADATVSQEQRESIHKKGRTSQYASTNQTDDKVEDKEEFIASVPETRLQIILVSNNHSPSANEIETRLHDASIPLDEIQVGSYDATDINTLVESLSVSLISILEQVDDDLEFDIVAPEEIRVEVLGILEELQVDRRFRQFIDN